MIVSEKKKPYMISHGLIRFRMEVRLRQDKSMNNIAKTVKEETC